MTLDERWGKWFSCLDVNGVLLLEHCGTHTSLGSSKIVVEGKEVFPADIFGASFGEYLALILSPENADVLEVLRSPVRWNSMACRIIVSVRKDSSLNMLPAGNAQGSGGPVMKASQPK